MIIKLKVNNMNYNRVVDFVKQNYADVIDNGLMDDVLVNELFAKVEKLNDNNAYTDTERKGI